MVLFYNVYDEFLAEGALESELTRRMALATRLPQRSMKSHLSIRKVIWSTTFYEDTTFQSHALHVYFSSFFSSFFQIILIKLTLCAFSYTVQGSLYVSSAFKSIQRHRDKFPVLGGFGQLSNSFEICLVGLDHGPQLWLHLKFTWAASPGSVCVQKGPRFV